MKKFSIPFVFLTLLLTAYACGRLNDEFGRDVNGYTKVGFASPRHLGPLATQNGGIIIYFLDQSNQQSLTAFAFPNEDIANSSFVSIKNGAYKVYALSFVGASPGSGQTRCAQGNSGSIIPLDGGAKMVSINMTTAACDFGNNSLFSISNDAYSGNFKDWSVKFCGNSPYPSCTASATTSSVRMSLMAGERMGLTSFGESPASLRSFCVDTSTASGSITAFNPPIGGATLAYPFKLEVYGDASCSTSIVRTYNFPDGLVSYTASSSGSGKNFLSNRFCLV